MLLSIFALFLWSYRSESVQLRGQTHSGEVLQQWTPYWIGRWSFETDFGHPGEINFYGTNLLTTGTIQWDTGRLPAAASPGPIYNISDFKATFLGVGWGISFRVNTGSPLFQTRLFFGIGDYTEKNIHGHYIYEGYPIPRQPFHATKALYANDEDFRGDINTWPSTLVGNWSILTERSIWTANFHKQKLLSTALAGTLYPNNGPIENYTPLSPSTITNGICQYRYGAWHMYFEFNNGTKLFAIVDNNQSNIHGFLEPLSGWSTMIDMTKASTDVADKETVFGNSSYQYRMDGYGGWFNLYQYTGNTLSNIWRDLNNLQNNPPNNYVFNNIQSPIFYQFPTSQNFVLTFIGDSGLGYKYYGLLDSFRKNIYGTMHVMSIVNGIETDTLSIPWAATWQFNI